METLYRIGAHHRNRAREVLTSAFHEEIEILTTRYGLKRRTAQELFVTPLVQGYAGGEVYASSEQMEGLMVVLPGEHATFGLVSLLASGTFFRLLGALKLMVQKDVRTTLSQMMRDKKALTIGPYYYVAVLGVAREHQGRGVGGRLLATLCKRADAEGRALYLETQTSSNVAWYQGFGFNVLKRLGSADTMQIWEMARTSPRLDRGAIPVRKNPSRRLP